MKSSEAIENAIDRIQGVGWRRGANRQHPDGPSCLVQSFGRWDWGWKINDLFRDVMGTSRAANWNDNEAADKWEVVAVLLTMYNLAVKAGD